MATWATELAHTRRELEEATGTVWSNDSILQWYNDGAADFASQTRALRGKATFTTATNVQGYSLATNTLDISAVRVGATVLVAEDIQEWELLSGNPLTKTGAPFAYSIVGASIFLRPMPDCTSTVTYFRAYAPTAIIAATNTTPFQGKYDRVIRDYVKSRAYEQVSDFDSANFSAQRYMAEIQNVQKQLGIAHSVAPHANAPREVF